MAELYAGDQGERETLKNFILSGGEAHYLCNGAPTYIGSVKEIGGSGMEDWGNRWEKSCISDQSIEQLLHGRRGK